MKYLQKRLVIPLAFIVLLFTISIQTPVEAVGLIYEDFEDMNYDNWGTYGEVFNRTENRYYPANSANFSASDKTLKVTGPAGDWLRQLYSIAYLNHSVNYGTWSFDLYMVDTPGHEIVIFLLADSIYPSSISNNISEPSMTYGYIFVILTYGSWTNYDRPLIEFWYINNGVDNVIDRYNLGPSGSTWPGGWTHFDIIRNLAGHFYIYLNGTLCMSIQPPVHNIPSGYFTFGGQAGHAIDNLTIQDIPIPSETTETTTSTSTSTSTPTTPTQLDLTPVLLSISSIELVVIVLLVVLYFKQRKSG